MARKRVVLCSYCGILDGELNRTRKQILAHIFLHTLGKTCVSEAQIVTSDRVTGDSVDGWCGVMSNNVTSIAEVLLGNCRAKKTYPVSRFCRATSLWLITALPLFSPKGNITRSSAPDNKAHRETVPGFKLKMMGLGAQRESSCGPTGRCTVRNTLFSVFINTSLDLTGVHVLRCNFKPNYFYRQGPCTAKQTHKTKQQETCPGALHPLGVTLRRKLLGPLQPEVLYSWLQNDLFPFQSRPLAAGQF